MFSLSNEIFSKITKNLFFNINKRRALCSSNLVAKKYHFNAKLEKSVTEENGLFQKNLKLYKKNLGFVQQHNFFTLSKQLFSEKITADNSLGKIPETSDLVIERHKEGIVEIQLNRPKGKNSLSKKLTYEVFTFFQIYNAAILSFLKRERDFANFSDRPGILAVLKLFRF